MESGTCIVSNGCEVNTQGEDRCSEPTQDSIMKSHAHVEDSGKIIEEPRLGMEFDSDVSAFKFYSNYSGRIGFKVRKQHLKKSKDGFVTRRRLCCSKEGQRKDDKRRLHVLYRQPVSRVGCKAHMTCLLQKNGKYRIVSFDPNHNHELGRTPSRHMVTTDQHITDVQKAYAVEADKFRIPFKSTIELMGREIERRQHLGLKDKDSRIYIHEVHAAETVESKISTNKSTIELMGREIEGRQHLVSTDKDSRNYIHGKRKKTMEKGDAGAILQYFQKMQLENSSYFYSIQLDEDDMITNVFWVDARSASDYALFGDVVCFDATYRINDCGRPFAPFIGVNHHRQTMVFGAAFLYDETIDSFKWLFKTFLGVMSGKQPKTILTDRSDAMTKAISEVFPNTQHRLCVTHIYQNIVKNLSHLFNGSNQFLHDLSECIYDHDDEDEWLSAWNNMLEKYNIKENVVLKALFGEKKKWALVYGRHTFGADMKATQRSRSIINALKEYLESKHDIMRFFEHYERALADLRYEEHIADFKMMQSSPPLSASVEMLRHGAEVYTPEVFILFQKEYMNILNCSVYKVCKFGATYEYKVACAGKSKEHLVKFEASTYEVVCSCMKFTFSGILCAHALKVLDKKNVKNIPLQYIMTRWTRDAKASNIPDYRGNEISDNSKESNGKRYSHLFRKFCEIASFASEHEKLTSYAHERLAELLENLQEMKKRIPTQEFHKDNGSQFSLPTHLATTTMHEKFGTATSWQINQPFAQ